jgi:hypothetical protein
MSGGIMFDGYIADRNETIYKHSHLSLSAAFGFGIFSGDAAYNAISQSSASSYSQYATIKATYRTAPVVASIRKANGSRNITLTDEAKRLLDHRDWIGFRDKCGDSFIAGAVYGANYEGRLIVETTSQEAENEVSGAFNAAMTGFLVDGKVDASAQETLKKTLKTHHTQFDHSYLGDNPGYGGGATAKANCGPDALTHIPSSNLDEMIKFAQSLDCRAHAAVPIEWVTVRYDQIDDRAAFGTSADESPAISALMMLYDRWAGLENVRDHLGDFGPYDKNLVNQRIAETRAKILELSQAFRDADGESTKVHDPAAVNRVLFDIARSGNITTRAPKRAALYRPNMKNPQEIKIDFFSNDVYPVRLQLQGWYTLDENNGAVRCPSDCNGDANYIFRDVMGAAVKTVSMDEHNDAQMHQTVDVPPNSTAYFKYHDESPPAGYQDNNWFSGSSGFLAYEVLN